MASRGLERDMDRLAKSIERDIELLAGLVLAFGALAGAAAVKVYDWLSHRHRP